MSHTLELRMLRKVPKKYREDRVYSGEELKGLETAWNMEGLNDAYHVPIRTVSRYASMDDIKAYILGLMPDADMRCWSMHDTHDGGVEATLTDGTRVDIPAETVKTLEKDHESTSVYENQDYAWGVDVSLKDVRWLEHASLGYITKKSLKKLLETRMAVAAATAATDLDESIGEYGESWSQERDIFGMLSESLALARKTGKALYACLLD